MIELKYIFGILAILLTFVAFYPYISSIRQGNTRPHVFSWVIWSITTCIVFVAQLVADGGFGAWPIGLSGLITAYIAWLAFAHSKLLVITRSDWFFLVSALCSLPLWFVTDDPLYAVIVLTTVDILGFAPTLRKAYQLPWEEHCTFYLLFVLRNVFAIIALNELTLTTVLFPLVISSACIILVAVIAMRRMNPDSKEWG